MDKANVVEPTRTPCAVCGKPATTTGQRGEPLCSLCGDTKRASAEPKLAHRGSDPELVDRHA